MNNSWCSDDSCEINITPEEVALRNLRLFQTKIKQICIDHGRKPDACRVLPVSKTIPQEVLRYFCKNGEKVFGENKVQELESKYTGLSDQDPEWHFIGHLQSNKVKNCIKLATMVHSVDRLKLAVEMDRCLQRAGKSMPILIQVNTSGEASKFGVSPEQLIGLAREIRKFDTLKIKGLMTLAVLSRSTPLVRRCFQELKALAERIQNEAIMDVDMSELSMGMTSDFEVAVQEGATIVRIGQGIFGPRGLPDSHYWKEESK